MKTECRKYRTTAYLTVLLAVSVGLAACGGGGSGSARSGAASLSVSLAAAPGFPAGTTFAAPAAAPAAPANPGSAVFDNVLVTVTKIALIPSSGPEFPAPDGEPEERNAPAEEGGGGMSGFVTVTLPDPVTVDLLNAPPPFEAAILLNLFESVPAGEYSKIRVYYEDVVGRSSDPDLDNVPFHPTAHYHFDVHFVGGNLVIPVGTSAEGIRFQSVLINVVGLKITQAGGSGNFLMRPQVFATVESPGELRYVVRGTATDVDASAGTFLILTDAEPVPAVYGGGTNWRYVDPSFPAGAWQSAGNALGSAGLENTAIVTVIGPFSSGLVLQAESVDVTFPDVRSGNVFLGWNPDNTFTLRLPSDNTVFPMPSREGAYYDNAVTFAPLTDASIVDNAAVTARGYAVLDGIRAFWISVGN
ncbi:MAG TPA: hypothetical protein VE080_00720 [Candidatus Aquicultoraceae bacterium]|nr:hypothetical protein [Candidatus Aquicultoraceae bacterium]